MNETVFEKIETAASVLKLDFSSEEFANFAEEQELTEDAIDAVLNVLSYLSEKKQHTTIQTLLKMSRLPTKAPKTFENFDFSLLKGRDVERLKALPSLASIYSHRNLAFIGPAGTGKTHLAQAFGYNARKSSLNGVITNTFGLLPIRFSPSSFSNKLEQIKII